MARTGCACGGTCPACRANAHDHEPEASVPQDLANAETPMRPPAGMEGQIRATRADGAAHVGPGATAAVGRLASGGRPLPGPVRAFFEPRFATDFSQVRVHDGPAADAASGAVGARAFTLGRDIAFAAGEFAPGTTAGRHLLAHELAQVAQQRSSPAPLIQRRETPRRTPARPAPALDFRPAINTPPCACLVFVHNDERNARRAVQALHRVCRYNLAIVGDEAARGRTIRVPGAGAKDPNALFPSEIRTDCEADLDACRTEAAGRDNLRATQMSYYLAIRDCTNNFALPLVALHNNLINDTARMRRHRIDPATNSGLSRRYAAEPTGDQLSIDELRQRLRDLGMSRGAMRGLLTSSGTTNIYRWCNLPEIGRCAVGDPARPDHVIWVVRDDDFERLANGGFNVVQQTSAAEGSESDTDLSTMLLGIEDARYINIETPHTAKNQLDEEPQRVENMTTILLALRAAGLECCDVDSSSDEDTEG